MNAVVLALSMAFAVGVFLADVAGGADLAKGKEAFQQYCASCHGSGGRGDGPMGVRMNPKPKDLTDKAYNASMTDEYMAKIILEGGKPLGKSAMMPKLGGALKESDAAVLVAYIRSLAK